MTFPARTITFVRHAQSLSNAGGVTMEHGAIPLTELGHRQAQRLADDLHDPLARVERGERVLEHHLHLPAERLELPAACRCDVVAAERDAPAGGIDQAHDRAGQRRLAAARLAHQADGLPLGDVQRHVVHGVHPRDLAVDEEPLEPDPVLAVDGVVEAELLGEQGKPLGGAFAVDVAQWLRGVVRPEEEQGEDEHRCQQDDETR